MQIRVAKDLEMLRAFRRYPRRSQDCLCCKAEVKLQDAGHAIDAIDNNVVGLSGRDRNAQRTGQTIGATVVVACQ